MFLTPGPYAHPWSTFPNPGPGSSMLWKVLLLFTRVVYSVLVVSNVLEYVDRVYIVCYCLLIFSYFFYKIALLTIDVNPYIKNVASNDIFVVSYNIQID